MDRDIGVRSRFGLLRTLAFRDALMGKASCFSWSHRMDCGKTSAKSLIYMIVRCGYRTFSSES